MLRYAFLVLSSLMFSGVAFAVDVNVANREQLQTVRGIGPNKAEAVLEERSRRGPFKSWDDFEARTQRVGHRTAQHVQEAGITLGTAVAKAPSTTVVHNLRNPSEQLTSTVSLTDPTRTVPSQKISRNAKRNSTSRPAQSTPQIESAGARPPDIEVAAMAVTLDKPEQNKAAPKRIAQRTDKKTACAAKSKLRGCGASSGWHSAKRQ